MGEVLAFPNVTLTKSANPTVKPLQPLSNAAPNGTAEKNHFLITSQKVFLKYLTLENFRNYTLNQFEFLSPMIILLGNNGVGKTNLLEAISLLAPGRGLKPTSLIEKIKFGSKGFRLKADFFEINHNHKTATTMDSLKLEFFHQEQKLKTTLNQTQIKAKERALSCLWVLPRHDRLFQEPAQERRRFLDKLIATLDQNHLKHVLALQALLKQRRHLIEQRITDQHWFSVLEKRIAQHSIAVAAARVDYIKKLNLALARSQQLLTFLPATEICLSGYLEQTLSQTSAQELEQTYCQYLSEHRTELDGFDGAHNSDLIATHLPKNLAAQLCSTGEQKLLLLAFMIAAVELLTAEFGKPPFFLLDDALAHLDANHRKQLLGLLQELQLPCFITGTDQQQFVNIMNHQTQFITLPQSYT